MAEPKLLDDAGRCVDEIISVIGKQISIGVPLGLGKPVALLNALYERACADPSIHLRILTALTLEKPKGGSALERAFLQPFVDRVYGDCPDILYARDLSSNKLPPNVEVVEFFVAPGSRLGNAHSQQHYISSNYTHAARDVFEQGCNVVAQMACSRVVDGQTRYSMSCNPDTGPELMEMLDASGRKYLSVAELNQNLPYMEHDAEVGPEVYDLVLEHPSLNTTLFSTPKQPVATADHLIGIYASSLLKDGGTLQIGIGALGDAIANATRLRHQNNAQWRQAITATGVLDTHAALVRDYGGVDPFTQGLYGATEMFVDGFLNLYEAGVLKRRVYDDENLQRLLNDGRVDPDALGPEVLDLLEAEGERVIRTHEFVTLQHHGLFRDDCRYDLGHIIAPDGERIMANLAIPESRQKLAEKCLGKRLRNGVVLHGGFFLGPRSFYRILNQMPDEERYLFCMSGVYKINQLDHAPDLYKAQRVHARFMNTGLMATVNGAVVSDGLDDGRAVSGVGGQYNFVAMAHQLRTGRSVLMVRAVREKPGAAPSSNIVSSYGHTTIPRHLRDIVITEYGIADLRSQSDSEVIKRMICIADSRFQAGLIATAQAAGKIEAGWTVPEAHRNNTPARLEKLLDARREHFAAFPFGSDFSDEELLIAKALKAMKARVSRTPKWKLLLRGLRATAPPAAAAPWLERMQLTDPKDLQARVAQSLYLEELKRAGAF